MPSQTAGHARADASDTPPGPLPGGGAHVPPGGAESGRTARKRRAIMEAATALFLRDGYRNTSMDQVAADAAVSKQTVYKQFADKEQLFRDIVLGVTGNSEAIITDMTSALRSTNVASHAELRTVLTDLGVVARHRVPGPVDGPERGGTSTACSSRMSSPCGG